MLPEPISVTLQVTRVLEGLGIPYFISGSMATAVHGIARTTMDVDLVVEINIGQVAAFVQSFEDAFFVDEVMIRNALRQGMSFNIIHRESMFKVDFFVKKDRTFDQLQFDRRASHQLSEESDSSVYLATPEDLILAKLEWYRMSGEVSDRQWVDIINVIKVQGENLNLEYLRTWADNLALIDLLERVLTESS